MAGENSKVDRDSGPSGGNRLNVRAGGQIRVISVGTGGGKLVGSGGTRASHIANRVAATATSVAALDTAVASLASGVNSVLTLLRNIGTLATA